jgi:hypothetical protein
VNDRSRHSRDHFQANPLILSSQTCEGTRPLSLKTIRREKALKEHPDCFLSNESHPPIDLVDEDRLRDQQSDFRTRFAANERRIWKKRNVRAHISRLEAAVSSIFR